MNCNCRGGSTLSLFPEKDELILFGGEYYNGNKVNFKQIS